MLAAGVDTWSICWYLAPGSAPAIAAEKLATVPTRRGRKLSEEVWGHNVGFFPGSHLLYAEGKPSGSDRLAGLSELQGAAESVSAGLMDLGLVVPTKDFRPLHPDNVLFGGGTGFAGVRRLDLTADLERRPEIGRAILRGVAVVEPPGSLQSETVRAPRGMQIQTVSWKSKSGVQARVYDKGVESNSREPGELIRFETQQRFGRGHRLSISTFAAGFGELLFRNRFEPLRAATKGIVVTDQQGVVERLRDLVETGDITPSEAKSLAGLLLFESQGVEVGSRTTRWRDRQRLARAGVLLSDGMSDPEEIDLAAELEPIFEVPFDRAIDE